MVIKVCIGKLNDCEGNKIEGGFLDHKAEGVCEIKYKNGSVYNGNLSKGLKKGTGFLALFYEIMSYFLYKGKFFDNLEKFEYDGDWENDKKHGNYSVVWPF